MAGHHRNRSHYRNRDNEPVICKHMPNGIRIFLSLIFSLIISMMIFGVVQAGENGGFKTSSTFDLVSVVLFIIGIVSLVLFFPIFCYMNKYYKRKGRHTNFPARPWAVRVATTRPFSVSENIPIQGLSRHHPEETHRQPTPNNSSLATVYVPSNPDGATHYPTPANPTAPPLPYPQNTSEEEGIAPPPSYDDVMKGK